MSQANTPQPIGEPKPIWDPPSKPQGPRGDPHPSIPEEDDPEIEETEEQPS